MTKKFLLLLTAAVPASKGQTGVYKRLFPLWLLVAVSGLLLGSPLQGQVVVGVWNGGVGNWTTAADWTPNGAPNNINAFAQIDNGNAAVSVVTANGTIQVAELSIDAGDSLVIGDGGLFIVTAETGFAGAGSVVNHGSIVFGSTGDTTDFFVSIAVTLTGGGTVTMANSARFESGGVLTNVDNTIQGDTSTGGTFGNMQTTIINEAAGVIDANVATKTLLVSPGAGGVTNTGLMEATNGGILQLSEAGGGFYDNTGGTIQALDGSQVQLTAGAAITGGTLTTAGTGAIVNLDTASLTDLTNAGAFVGNNASTTTIAGTIDNSGSISLNSTGAATFLNINGDTSLTGGGTVNLVSGDVVGGTGTLTNAGNTIQGETTTLGSLGNGEISIVNEAAGVIDANVATKTLLVIPGAGGVTNTGLMEATNGGILQLSGEIGGLYNNTGGTIQALDGSQVQLTAGAAITGGTLTTAGTGAIVNLDIASLTNVTNSGAFVGSNASTTTLAGTINNSGSISLNSTGAATFLNINGDTSLTGGGTVNLVGGDVVGGTGTLTNAGNTIQGETGTLGSLGNGEISIVNEAAGVIDANVATKTLVVIPGAGGVTNMGLMEATNGGILQLTGTPGGLYDNTGGTIQALDGSQVQLTAGASITGGTLATAGTGVIVNLDTASLTNVTNSGAFVGDNASFTTIAGTIHNTGSISLHSTGAATFLNINGNTSLTGGGTVNLISGDTVGGTGTLTNAGNTIQGETATSGSLGDGRISIVNQGLINANVSGQTLLVFPSSDANSFVNDPAGIVRASGGGILQLTGGTGAFTNDGTFDAMSGSTLRVGGTLTQSSTGLVTGGGTLVTAGFTSNGTVTPGDGGAPGSLAITGDYTQTASGKLVIQVNGPTAGTGYSVLHVSGNVNVAGSLQIQSAGLFPGVKGEVLTILTSGTAVTGSFTLSNLSGLGFQLVYDDPKEATFGDPNNVELTISQLTFARPALTPNQAAVAADLDRAVPFATGGAAILIGTIDVLPPSALPGVLDQLSPQSLQVFRSIAFDNATFNSQQLNDHLANLRDGLTGFDGSQLAVTDSTLDPTLSQINSRLLAWNPNATPGLMSDVVDPILGGVDMKDMKATPSVEAIESASPWSTFIAGNVVLADLSHSEDVEHQDYTTGSVMLGADYRIDRHFTLGALLAYGHTDANLDHNGSSATVDSYSPGVYASYVDGGWYGNGLFSYGYNSYTEDRNVSLGALSGFNHGAPQGNQYTGNLTGGYEFQRGGWKFGPVASIQYVNLGINSFNEDGPTALNIRNQSAESLRSQLGIEARYAVRTGSVILTPHISASWQHEFLDGSDGITSQFNQVGAGSFTVQTENAERDSAFIDVGLDAQVAGSVTLFADYQTEAGQSDFFAQSVQAGLKIGF